MEININTLVNANNFYYLILSARVYYIGKGSTRGSVMKAFVVLDNDVCFYEVDTQFKKYMLQKCLDLKIVKVCLCLRLFESRDNFILL